MPPSARPILLLQREWALYQRDPQVYKGITVRTSETWLVWHAIITGYEDSVWEGLPIHINIEFPNDFDASPPKFTVLTVPFHPNISTQGEISADILLASHWRPGTSILSLLVHFQDLLTYPDEDTFLNREASEMIKKSMRIYYQIVEDCIVKFHRLSAGIDPLKPENPPMVEDNKLITIKPPPTPEPSSRAKVNKISFDDYYASWKSLCTAKKDAFKFYPKRKQAAIKRQLTREEKRRLHDDALKKLYSTPRDSIMPSDSPHTAETSVRSMKQYKEMLEERRLQQDPLISQVWKQQQDESNEIVYDKAVQDKNNQNETDFQNEPIQDLNQDYKYNQDVYNIDNMGESIDIYIKGEDGDDNKVGDEVDGEGLVEEGDDLVDWSANLNTEAI